jgi:phosphodiesterase/alkaline phosphatase D-like protein
MLNYKCRLRKAALQLFRRMLPLRQSSARSRHKQFGSLYRTNIVDLQLC